MSNRNSLIDDEAVDVGDYVSDDDEEGQIRSSSSGRAVWDSSTTQTLTDYLGLHPEATANAIKRDVFPTSHLSSEQIQRKLSSIRRANKQEKRQNRNKQKSSMKSSVNSHRSRHQTDSGPSKAAVVNVDVDEKVADAGKVELVQMINNCLPDEEVIITRAQDGKYTIFSWSMSYNQFDVKLDSTERRLYRIVQLMAPPEDDLKKIFKLPDLSVIPPQNSAKKYFFTPLAEDLDVNSLQIAKDVKNQKY